MKKLFLAMAAMAVFAAGSVQAADEAGQLVQFKAGEVSFTLLQADGVTPMKAAELKMLSPEDSRVMAEAVSDHLGQAAVALAEGRYLLNVSGRTLSVMDVAADATLTSCRVVVPEAALMVAGQEGEEDQDEVGAPVWLTPVIIGGVAVLVAGGAYAIYDNNKDDDDDDGDNGGDDGLPPPPPPVGGDDDDDDDDRDEIPPSPTRSTPPAGDKPGPSAL